jgi:hypothetical protein
MHTCRECEREINQATEICPYCGADLSAPAGGESERPQRTPAQIVLRWAVLLGVLAGVLWGFLWYILPARNGSPTLEAETRAIAALTELRAALGNYAEAQGGAYPISLEPLGDSARQPAQNALSLGYQLQYAPGPISADGLVHTYVLLARAGNFGYRNFYTDETGVLRATKENRGATPQDPSIGSAGPAKSP